MGETRDQRTASESFERRLNALLATELAEAERDFQPLVPSVRQRRFASWSVVVVAAVLLPVALVGVIAVGANWLVGPTGSAPARIDPSSSNSCRRQPRHLRRRPATGLATVVATFESEADTLTYDARRGVVWIPAIQPVGRDVPLSVRPSDENERAMGTSRTGVPRDLQPGDR